MSNKWKTGDKFPLADYHVETFAPSQRQVDTLQAFIDTYDKHGYTLSLSDAVSLMGEADAYGTMYADLANKLTTGFDTSNLDAVPLSEQLATLRNEILALRSWGVTSSTLTTAQTGAIKTDGGKLSIDYAKKLALYPLTLTADEATTINKFWDAVELIETLQTSLGGGRIDVHGNQYVMKNGLTEKYYVNEFNVGILLCSSHSF